MKLFDVADYYTKVKLSPNNSRRTKGGLDEFDESPDEFCIFGSNGGYFGLEESVENYKEIHEVIDKSIFGEIVKAASKDYKSTPKPEKRGHGSNGNFDFRGIKVTWIFDPFGGLIVWIPTDYVKKNYNKLNIEVPAPKVPGGKGLNMNFSERVSKVFNFTKEYDDEVISKDFSREPLSELMPNYKVYVSSTLFRHISDDRIIETNDIYFIKSLVLAARSSKYWTQVNAVVEDPVPRLIKMKYCLKGTLASAKCIVVPGSIFNVFNAMYIISSEKPTAKFIKENLLRSLS